MFRLGLAMAGAVSAGAYTAGVLDFMFEALDAWEQARVAEPARTPNHRVVLQALSGTSAGGMCAALSTLALARGLRPTVTDPDTGVRCVLPELYESLVTAPNLVGPGGGDARSTLLGLADLGTKGPLRSLLDGSLLEEVGRRALEGGRAAPGRIGFIADPLHVFLTFSNLEGLPYALNFDGESAAVQAYPMRCHADRVHFRVDGMGVDTVDSAWLQQWQDAGVQLDIGALGQEACGNWQLLVDAALATGAVPGGLPARRLALPPEHFAARAYPMADPLAPQRLRACWNGAPPTAATAVDGGLLNNEPFELARWTIMAEPGRANERSPAAADRAIVLIDPLPEPPKAPVLSSEAAPLLGVIGALIPALMNQTRFKPSELTQAADEAVASRFLITPEGDGVRGEAALATAGLSAFGGFLDESFRAHDFALGRRNCQAFLLERFALAAGNPLYATWSSEVAADPDWALGRGRRAIIPLLGTAREPLPVPAWSSTPTARLDEVMRSLGARADAMFDRLVPALMPGRFQRFVVNRIWKMKREEVLNAVAGVMRRELTRRGQLATGL